MQIYVENLFKDENIISIAESLDLKTTTKRNKECNLIYNERGLSFFVDPLNKNHSINIDFMSGKLGWRSTRPQNESLLKKTLGRSKEKLKIFDATPGFLSDTMIFLSMGHKVVAVEQSKIIFHLVNDAIRRASPSLTYLKNLSFCHGESFNYFDNAKDNFDVIYLDPMYPDSRKKVKKTGSVEALKFILDYERKSNQNDELVLKFLANRNKKIILKRPLKSNKKYNNINYQVKGKTTRFDIYL